jgi:hypothetical protein
MTKVFINNFKIIFAALVIFTIIRGLLNDVLWRIKSWVKNSSLAKNKLMIDISKIIFIYSLLVFLVTLQQSYHFIDLGKEENYITLVIGILTLYGIFYAFVQFAISCTFQNVNVSDKYWGRSKTRSLIVKNIEIEFFNSNTFKLLLLISVVVPIIKINTGLSTQLLASYKNFAIALWNVSVLSIYILYILLFIKSFLIMQRFFGIQERGDFFVGMAIKNEVIDEYKKLFYKSYKNRDNYFIKILFDDIKSINSEERTDMLYNVLYDSIYEHEKKQETQIRKIKQGKKISKRVIDEFGYKAYDLMEMFLNLWRGIEKHKIELKFEELLSFYKLQDRILFNQIFISCLGNDEEIIKNIIYVYDNKIRNLYLGNFHYFKVPNIIWDKITYYEGIIELNHYVNKREATGKLLERYLNDLKEYKLTNNEKILIQEYENYLQELLNKCRVFQSKIKKDDLVHLFGSYNSDEHKIKISPTIQNQIYYYIIDLEYSLSNKEYIKILAKGLEYKYILTMIFYKMLYTGGDSYLKWQEDILFLHNVINDYYDDEKIDSEVNINFICKTISKSNIGRRIGGDLIRWIIKNLKGEEITEDIIKRCNEDKYLSYAKFLKLKYIFYSNYYFYPSFTKANLSNLQLSEWNDWRLTFLKDILITPSILKEEFFFTHQYRFFEEVFQPMIPRYLYQTQDFRMFYINISFQLSEDQFFSLISEESFLGNGIFEFLILKIEDEYYNYLFSNSEIYEIFIKKIKDIIDSSNTSIECYVASLVNKANECIEDSISVVKKERIISKLKI